MRCTHVTGWLDVGKEGKLRHHLLFYRHLNALTQSSVYRLARYTGTFRRTFRESEDVGDVDDGDEQTEVQLSDLCRSQLPSSQTLPPMIALRGSVMSPESILMQLHGRLGPAGAAQKWST